MSFQIFYATSGNGFTENNSRKYTVSKGTTEFEVSISKGNYQKLRFDFGDLSGITFDVKDLSYVTLQTINSSSPNLTVSDIGLNYIKFRGRNSVGITSDWSNTVTISKNS